MLEINAIVDNNNDVDMYASPVVPTEIRTASCNLKIWSFAVKKNITIHEVETRLQKESTQ